MRTNFHFRILGMMTLVTSCSNVEFVDSRRGKPTIKAAESSRSQPSTPDSIAPSTESVVVPLLPADHELSLSYVDTSDPLKLVLIVDDSSSMKPKQNLLAAGLDLTLDRLKGKNVSVFLYSSSIFKNTVGNSGSNSMDYYTLRLTTSEGATSMTWGGYHPGAFFSGSLLPSYDVETRVKRNGLWVNTASTILDYVPEASETKFVINKSGFKTASGSLNFNASMPATEFSALKEKLKSELMIGESGHSQEMPLCTLALLLKNEGKNAIFSKGDRVAFLMISDEDQTTKLTVCPYRSKMTVTRHSETAATAYHRESFVVMNYGAKCDSTASDGYCRGQPWAQRIHTSCKTNPLCEIEKPVGTSYPCTPAQKADYLAWFATAYKSQIASGDIQLLESDTCTAYASNFVRHGKVAVPWGTTKTSPVTIAGTTYPSVPDYYKQKFPNDIFTGEIAVDPHYGNSSFSMEPVNGITQASDLPQSIRADAHNLFGPSNVVISTIGNQGSKNPAGCVADPTAESKILNQTSDLTSSICESDYSTSLTWLEKFSSKRLVDTYKVDPSYLDGSYDLSLLVNGVEKPLQSSEYSYDVTTLELTIKVGVHYHPDNKIYFRKKN